MIFSFAWQSIQMLSWLLETLLVDCTTGCVATIWLSLEEQVLVWCAIVYATPPGCPACKSSEETPFSWEAYNWRFLAQRAAYAALVSCSDTCLLIIEILHPFPSVSIVCFISQKLGESCSPLCIHQNSSMGDWSKTMLEVKQQAWGVEKMVTRLYFQTCHMRWGWMCFRFTRKCASYGRQTRSGQRMPACMAQGIASDRSHPLASGFSLHCAPSTDSAAIGSPVCKHIFSYHGVHLVFSSPSRRSKAVRVAAISLDQDIKRSHRCVNQLSELWSYYEMIILNLSNVT